MRIIKSVACAFLAGAVGFSFSPAAERGDDSDIRIGSSLPLGGPGGYLGLAASHGFEAYLRSVNDAGGIAGKKIRLIVYNDGNDPQVCARNTRKLIGQDRVLALTCYVGTTAALRAQAIWTEARVPAIGFLSGAEVLRAPFNRYTIHMRASCFQETSALIDALRENRRVRRVAVVYQDDAFGEAVRRGTELALTKHGLHPVRYAPFAVDTTNFDAAIDRIKAARPEAVVMAGTYLQFTRFIKKARRSGLRRTVFCAVSTVGTEAFAKTVGGAGAGCIISQVMPLFAQSRLPVVDQYRATLKKYFPADDPSSAGLEGFVTAQVVVQGIRRCGEDVNGERLIDAIESMRPDELQNGLFFEFGPENHQGLSNVYLTQIRRGVCREITDWESFKR